ncbi:DUF1853 family protein [Aestuariibaculum suncheonense]|uniref:DUF1853 family protein n=1 Tax=Aestuariibaculum suncheonense TaxID=1028745 RepID=A0A8J6QTF9_9FLAO|nr:DUF1853 family protein [Aestuariibaculum suncheonense]MBD0835464.1 DUF1853 family protein [Aestuariibaculum suncheonense]
MHYKIKTLQQQYQGYAQTPLLWTKQDIFGLKQLDINLDCQLPFTETVSDGLRLGKRVERFVSHELRHTPQLELLAENIQIQQDKLTLGELDVLLLHNNRPIHLEIVYKFYLYDASVGTHELEHWIGPNRSDTLVKKLDKLKNKQLPLLFNTYTQPILKDLQLSTEHIQQRVWFKAQLFKPFQVEDLSFQLLNKTCLKGFYIHFEELKVLSDSKFFIPNKINWLQNTQTHVDWLNYDAFHQKVQELTNHKTSPLCWIKYPNGRLQKFFVVWWYSGSRKNP